MLLVNSQKYQHVSNDTVCEFENILCQTKEVKLASSYSESYYKFLYFIVRIFRKLKINIIPRALTKYKKKPLEDKKHLFTIMMALDEYKFKPYLLNSFHNKSIYLFDAWPKDYIKIHDFCQIYRINYLFVTSSLSTIQLKKMLPTTIVEWVPEAIDTTIYKFLPYHKKNIDVLAFGRKYDDYHLAILEKLQQHNFSYLFEKTKGELVFSSREEFINGLARTKISICFPSDLTHPARAGNVSTMTVRYLQSMAAKCLIVGHAPQEMIDLFGYNPVVEVDFTRPAEQLIEILNHYEDYFPLIERNYQEVIEHHNWQCRWNQIKEIYQQHTFL
ncbi:MAG TPA: hypothetical protein PLE52_05930 [Paludibacteraceae bacterium]|nr:hypothetical protein [Paludibacteraceae bacterium]